MKFVRIFAGVYCRGGDKPELSRLIIIDIMQHHLWDNLRCVAVCNMYYYESS